MIPRTKNGLDPFVCLSAMQKCIRRGMEQEAMEFACELLHSSKAFCSMVAKRLEIISHEDIDTGCQPHIVPFVHTASVQARDWWTKEKIGPARLVIGNAIRMMCRATKSREGDHFSGAIGLACELEGFKPTIPDWAYDHHTKIGRKKNRGAVHFRTISTKLVPPAEPDNYEDEFYRLLSVKISRIDQQQELELD